MKTILQRVSRAQVTVDGEVVGAIRHGALLLVGVELGDSRDDALATAEKIAKLRFFRGRTPMDRTLADVGGACLVVSQFTLAAAIHPGNRPSLTGAARPELANALYELVVERLGDLGIEVATGRFAAEMAVELVNDGPVTLIVETRAGRVV